MIWCADPWLISRCAAISFTVTSWWLQLLQWPLVSLLGGLTRSKSVCYRTNAFHELLSPLVHLLKWQTCITILDFHSSMNFDGYHPFTTLFFFGACCKWGGHLYITVPSCCIPASYCHLSATLQTMSNTVANLQENWAVFQIFIALLRFSFESPL
jgi:hypothetical protein